MWSFLSPKPRIDHSSHWGDSLILEWMQSNKTLFETQCVTEVLVIVVKRNNIMVDVDTRVMIMIGAVLVDLLVVVAIGIDVVIVKILVDGVGAVGVVGGE